MDFEDLVVAPSVALEVERFLTIFGKLGAERRSLLTALLGGELSMPGALQEAIGSDTLTEQVILDILEATRRKEAGTLPPLGAWLRGNSTG